MDIFSFWGILGVKNGRSNLENNRNDKNVFYRTGNDILQLFKVSAKKFKKKGLIVHTLLLQKYLSQTVIDFISIEYDMF